MIVKSRPGLQGYLDYRDMMNRVEGAPVGEERDRLWKSQGITKKDFKWDGQAHNVGFATVYLQHNVPVCIQWYEWDMSPENLLRNLEEGLGHKVKLINVNGGNGHYSAYLEVEGLMSIEQMMAQNKTRPWVEIQGRHWIVMGTSPTGQPDGVNDWSGWEETEDAAWEEARKKVKELTP